jgi:hypothetical protein
MLLLFPCPTSTFSIAFRAAIMAAFFICAYGSKLGIKYVGKYHSGLTSGSAPQGEITAESGRQPPLNPTKLP